MKYLNVRRQTGLFLLILVAILGGISILNNFNVWDFTPELATIVNLSFIIVVASEFGLMAVWKRKFGILEWIALAVVVLAIIPIITTMFQIENTVLDVYQGTITLVLIILGLISIFTKQGSES